MRRKFWLSTVGYLVTTMALAFPWHEIIFREKYIKMGAITRAEPIIPMGALSMVLQGLVFAYFFPLFLKRKERRHPIWEGVKYSLLIGVSVWSVMVFATAAKFQIEPISDFILLGTAFQALQLTAYGLILGFIYRGDRA